MGSVAVARVVIATVVATTVAVATVLLLNAEVGVVVKMSAIQTAPTASSCGARR